LDELWRDFNRKLGQFFGGKGGPQGSGGSGGGSGGPKIPVFFKNLGLGVVLAAALLVWLGTGFFIVQEGQQAVITQFGK
jgi:membrane protease subunit HflK